MRIIALDPGGTTGWATVSWMSAGEFVLTWPPQFECGHVDGPDHHNKLNTLLELLCTQSTIIVYEGYNPVYRDANQVDPISLEYIGVIKRFAQERELPIVKQSSSQGKVTKKSFVKKYNLSSLSIWHPDYKHAMDAYGHALWYLINTEGAIPAKEKNRLLGMGGWK